MIPYQVRQKELRGTARLPMPPTTPRDPVPFFCRPGTPARTALLELSPGMQWGRDEYTTSTLRARNTQQNRALVQGDDGPVGPERDISTQRGGIKGPEPYTATPALQQKIHRAVG